MQVDLHEFLTRLAGAMTMALVPVVLTAFLTLPSILNRSASDQLADPNAPMVHMT